MGRATVAARIAELDALSRVRTLTHHESRDLAQMIATERKYARSRVEQPPAPPILSIDERIRRTLARLAADKAEPRAIYLRPNDADALGAVATFDGVPVRRTTATRSSKIYTDRGVQYSVRQRA